MQILRINPQLIQFWEHQKTRDDMLSKALEELVDPENTSEALNKIQQYVHGDIYLFQSEPRYGWRNIPPIPLIRAPSSSKEPFLPYNGHTRRASAIHAGLPEVSAYIIENDDDFEIIKRTDEYNPNIAYAGGKRFKDHVRVIWDVAERIKEHPFVYS